jgi:hypothetical protein
MKYTRQWSMFGRLRYKTYIEVVLQWLKEWMPNNIKHITYWIFRCHLKSEKTFIASLFFWLRHWKYTLVDHSSNSVNNRKNRHWIIRTLISFFSILSVTSIEVVRNRQWKRWKNMLYLFNKTYIAWHEIDFLYCLSIL